MKLQSPTKLRSLDISSVLQIDAPRAQYPLQMKVPRMMGGAGLGSQEDGVSLSQAAGVALAPGQPPPWGRRGAPQRQGVLEELPGR